ncbi:MAG: phosphatase PAP2 family protein [Oceanobacter sp.]
MSNSNFREAFPVPLLYSVFLLLLLAGVIFSTGTNGSLFLLLNDLSSNLPDWVWANITFTGDTLFAVAAILVLASRKHEVFIMAFLLLVLGTLVTHGGKAYFDVLRPAGVLPTDTFNIIGPTLTKHSFPSGHSFTAFSCWTLLALNLRRRLLPVFVLLGVAGAFSRIAVGAHWPLDTLVGGSLGILVACSCVFLVKSVPCINQSAIRYFTAVITTLAVAYLPFYDDRFEDTTLLASLAGITALYSVIRYFWLPSFQSWKAR